MLGVCATSVVAAFAFAMQAGADAPPAGKTSLLAVTVGHFRNSNGVLQCRLFRTGDGFPERSEGTVEKRIVIKGKTARCDFAGLVAGTYAVSVMHDENKNQKLDKNFLGIPQEAYGVSNNHTYAMSSPTWEESKFVIEAGKNLGIAIALRY